MKFNKSLLIVPAAAMMLGSCSEQETVSGVANVVEGTDLTEAVACGTVNGRADSRTNRPVSTDGNYSLEFEWSVGDRIVVVDPAIPFVNGFMTLEEQGEKPGFGNFKGSIFRNGKDQFRTYVYYFGSAYGVDASTDTPVHIDMSKQTGTMDGLSAYDVMADTSEKCGFKLVGNKVAGEFTVTSRMSFARFTLDLPAGVRYNGEAVTVTETSDKLVNAYDLNLYTADDENLTYGPVTLTGAEATANGDIDIYMAVYPGSQLELSFSVTIGRKSYTGTYGPYDYEANEYYRRSDGTGSNVSMEAEKEDPSPENINNWIYPDTDPVIKGTSTGYTNLGYDLGWCHNRYTDIDPAGGWCRPFEVSSNGVQENTLMSSNRGWLNFWQWGRLIGFPGDVYNQLRVGGWGDALNDWYYPNLMFLCEEAKSTKLGYTYSTGHSDGCYASPFVVCETTSFYTQGWTKERAINSSICFGATPLADDRWADYVSANENCTWYERSGNPCPEGARVPTAAELQALIPVGGTVNGSAIQTVKAKSGKYYAMRWRVVNGNHKELHIASIPVPAADTEVTVADFADAPEMVIGAYGYLSNIGRPLRENQETLVWSSESASDPSLKGYGAIALHLVFNGNTVTMEMVIQDRVFGAQVIPFMSEDAPAPAKVQPVFPLIAY